MADDKWYYSIEKEVGSLKFKMGRDYSAYELDLLLRVARLISDHSNECSKCTVLQPEITNLIQSLADWPDIPEEQRKNFKLMLRSIENHLGKHQAAGITCGTIVIIVMVVVIAIIIIAVWQTCFTS